MAWLGIEGHDHIVELFRRILTSGRLAHTYLFVGPSGIGKRAFARRLAQSLLCATRPHEALDPCGYCSGCQQVMASTHPDLLLVSKPADKSFIPLEVFIGSKEKRRQEGLCHDLALKPFMGGRRIAIIDDADYMNEEGANSLLKTLEEPPPQSLMILIGTSADRQLPTIRSRAQLLRFEPLRDEVVARLLVAHQMVDDPTVADRLATHGEGSVERAAQLADPRLWDFRAQLLKDLAVADINSLALSRGISTFVDEAGKEAPPRRNRLRQVILFVVEFHRELLRSMSQSPATKDQELQHAVQTALCAIRFDESATAALIERSLDALQHIDRNANQSTLIECWIDDLTQIARRGYLAAV